MAFLLGAFGRAVGTQESRVSNVACEHTHQENLHIIHCENGILCAGYKKEENLEFSNDHMYVLPRNQGVLIGRIFDRTTYKSLTVDEIFAKTIIDDPRNISTSCWGRYTGVLYNKATHVVNLVRDPQGLFQLFYVIEKDLIIFSTELLLLYEAMATKPKLNMKYFAEYVISVVHASPITPFEGVSELSAGVMLSVRPDGSSSESLLWDPSLFSGTCISDEETFTQELLDTLKKSVNAWARDSSGVCVQLSGGTDSSGIMLLLNSVLGSGTQLSALNLIDSTTPSSNEIEYAQEIADICNAQMNFIDISQYPLFDTLPTTWRPNKPSTMWWMYGLQEKIVDTARSHNCQIIMDGQGGDHVFLAPTPKSALADYWLDNGFKGIKKPLHEISSTYRTPWAPLVYDMAKDIARYYLQSPATELGDMSFLESRYAQQFKQNALFLKDILKKQYPGKIQHILALAHAVKYSQSNNSLVDGTWTHPLLSQPVIEIALKIPTYQSFKDGFNRIFFRRAVSKIKHAKALWRPGKGGTTGTVAKACANQIGFIKDSLIGGKIVESGMINRQWLDEQLVLTEHRQNENLWPLLHLVTCQIWINQWKL